MIRGGPFETLQSFGEIEKIIGEKPIDFVENLINRFNEVRDYKIVHIEKFSKVDDYFREATKCYITGNFKASMVMAVAALECCIRLDFYYREGKEYKDDFYSLLNKYFDRGLLPPTYKDIANICRKIRNDIAHSNIEFDFSPLTVKANIGIIHYLVNNLLQNRQV